MPKSSAWNVQITVQASTHLYWNAAGLRDTGVSKGCRSAPNALVHDSRSRDGKAEGRTSQLPFQPDGPTCHRRETPVIGFMKEHGASSSLSDSLYPLSERTLPSTTLLGCLS